MRSTCCQRCEPTWVLADPSSWPVMVVCTNCGNKRCHHATDHRLRCTGSNEPGQPGSSYR